MNYRYQALVYEIFYPLYLESLDILIPSNLRSQGLTLSIIYHVLSFDTLKYRLGKILRIHYAFTFDIFWRNIKNTSCFLICKTVATLLFEENAFISISCLTLR
jgi:hypothetical protein